MVRYLWLIVLLSGCVDKDLVRKNSEIYCATRQGVEYIKYYGFEGSTTVCKNGAYIFDVWKVEFPEQVSE